MENQWIEDPNKEVLIFVSGKNQMIVGKVIKDQFQNGILVQIAYVMKPDLAYSNALSFITIDSAKSFVERYVSMTWG